MDNIKKVKDGMYEVENGTGTTYIFADSLMEAAAKYREMLEEERNWR